jgi:penicillin-binding protein 1C
VRPGARLLWRAAAAWAPAPGETRAGWWARVAVRGLLAAAAGTLLLGAWHSDLDSPEATLLLRDRHGRFLAEVGASRDDAFGYWPMAELPGRVVAAVLAVEDRRFWSHPGIDPVAVARAVRQNLGSGERVSGASTIAMQVARMQRPGPRTYPRKLVEAATALFLTARHGRERLLAHYLRLVPYGNRAHGIAYAARRYLDKPVEDLSWAETAFLCAIPQSPARMNPFRRSGRERAVRRGLRILGELHRSGALGDEEHALAREQIRSLRIPSPRERPVSALHAVLRFEERFRTPESRAPLAHRPVLRTSLDLDLQEQVAQEALRAVGAWESQGARNAAAVVLDRATSEVRAWVGSTDYFDRRHAGSIDYTDVPRSPGSALKPFVYALALERGAITAGTVLDDIRRGAGGIANADDRFLGPMLPRTALANSRNVPAADLLERVGLGDGFAFLQDLRLHDGSEPARRFGLGLAIGGLPVTLEQLVGAYTALAGEGRLRDPIWYEGQPVSERRVLSEETARQVALFLSDPMARLPSFPRMGATEYPYPVAVKTGTSSRYRDAWAVGFSTRYLVGVWIGDPDFRPMNHLSGYRSSAELLRRIFDALHRDEADGLEDLSFPPPRGFRRARLCALTGRLATDVCDRVLAEWLRPGEAPVDHCRAHVRVLVDARSGRVASRDTPPAWTEPRTFVDLAPRYAAWAAGARLPQLARLTLAGYAPGAASVPPRLSITSPEDGTRLIRDPEAPAGRGTLALEAIVEPPAPQVVWYVDGRPFHVAEHPYTARWPLEPGEHSFEARLPNAPTRSGRVRVVVQ